MKKILKFVFTLFALSLAACATGPMQPAPVERISPEELERLMPKPAPNLALTDIIQLSKDGVSPDEIIEKIKQSNSQYDLAPAQVVELSQAGVDTKVLDFIHQRREQALRDSMADEINKREQEKKQQEQKMRREMQLRSMQFYDPFWPYPPGGGFYHYGPFYRPGFRYGWGF